MANHMVGYNCNYFGGVVSRLCLSEWEHPKLFMNFCDGHLLLEKTHNRATSLTALAWIGGLSQLCYLPLIVITILIAVMSLKRLNQIVLFW